MGLITIANIHFKSREKSHVKILEIYLLNPAYSSSETLKVNAQIASQAGQTYELQACFST